MTEVFYVDAPSLVYRAYFALPKTITDPSGAPVNAVRGFLEMVTRLIVDHRPGRVIAVFDDDWRPAFRVDALPAYKAERPDEPEDLTHQFSVLEEVLDAAGLPRAISSGLEADDAIAALIRGKPDETRGVIVTGDRDLLALVRDPDVVVLFPVRGVSQMTRFDEAAVQSKYGVPSRLYSDFAVLRGDPSDGLPGVPGIGQVRAAELLTRFGSLEGVLARLDDLPERTAGALERSRPYLEAARKVVAFVEEAPVEVAASDPDEELLSAVAERNGLGSSAARLAQSLRGDR